MKTLATLLEKTRGILFRPAPGTSPAERERKSPAGIATSTLLATVALEYGEVSPAIRARARSWKGKSATRAANIKSLLDGLKARVPKIDPPASIIDPLEKAVKQLDELGRKLESGNITSNERYARNTLIATTVSFALRVVKPWVFGQFAEEKLTIDDVHAFGFMFPWETGGRHAKSEPTDVIAEIKSLVISANIARLIIDQAATKNAAMVASGWPFGVRTAVLVVYPVDGSMKELRLMTNKLHNDIVMPETCHGKQFMAKASFLKHVDDAPRWSNEITFSMPKTTGDIAREIH